MATQPKTLITPDEYLLRERAAPIKSEYYRGELFAMARASRAHSLIVSNLMIQIGSRLRSRDCEIHSSDMRLLVTETVSQSEMLVDHSVRQTDGGWLVKEIGPDSGRLSLSSLGIELSLADIYQKLELTRFS